MNAALFAGFGSVASFKMQVSRTMRKVGSCLAQDMFAPFALHKADGFRLVHSPALVLLPSFGKAGRELQFDQLSADDGVDIHAMNLKHPCGFDKPVVGQFRRGNFCAAGVGGPRRMGKQGGKSATEVCSLSSYQAPWSLCQSTHRQQKSQNDECGCRKNNAHKRRPPIMGKKLNQGGKEKHEDTQRISRQNIFGRFRLRVTHIK